jgi:hypothetical protein
MAHKITVTRSAIPESGQELNEAASAIFQAYENDGRMLFSEVSEDGLVVEMFFDSSETADAYLDEMKALGDNAKVEGAEVAKVERTDVVQEDVPLRSEDM